MNEANVTVSRGFGVCIICLDTMKDSPPHIICCLKCGHAFGLNCIQNWLSRKKTCPSCNAKATKDQIRVIYVPQITEPSALHPQQALLESLQNQLFEERKQRKIIEEQLIQFKDKSSRFQKLYEITKQRMLRERLFKGIGSLSSIDENKLQTNSILISTTTTTTTTQQQQLQDDEILTQPDSQLVDAASSSTNGTSHKSHITFAPIFESPVKGGRLIEHVQNEDILLATTEDSRGIAGLIKFSLRDPNCILNLPSLHVKSIRGICSNKVNSFILSASLDKTVKITNSQSFNNVMNCCFPTPMWSCCWDSMDTNYFFAGRQDGIISMSDIRNTQSFVWNVSLSSKCPINSLCSLKRTNWNQIALAAGTPEGVFMVEGNRNEAKQKGIPFPGSCIGFSRPLFQESLSVFAASFRQQQQQPGKIITVQKIFSVNEEKTEAIRVLEQPTFPQHMTRPALAELPNGTRLLLTSIEPTCQIAIWDIEKGVYDIINEEQLSSSSSSSSSTGRKQPILDICPFIKQGNSFLSTVSQDQLTIFSSVIE